MTICTAVKMPISPAGRKRHCSLSTVSSGPALWLRGAQVPARRKPLEKDKGRSDGPAPAPEPKQAEVWLWVAPAPPFCINHGEQLPCLALPWRNVEAARKKKRDGADMTLRQGGQDRYFAFPQKYLHRYICTTSPHQQACKIDYGPHLRTQARQALGSV
jgi:hypothetical protein